jgi:hypothetical protein
MCEQLRELQFNEVHGQAQNKAWHQSLPTGKGVFIVLIKKQM